MPVEFGLWRLGDKPEAVGFAPMESEANLEDTLAHDLSIIDPDLMLIGRQVMTDFSKRIDLLAMDEQGDLVVIELKRHRTPREVVAQAIDYASWVRGLSYEDVQQAYSESHDGEAFEAGFDEAFGAPPPEEVNTGHRIIIVASELDASTERLVDYLAGDYGVPINAVFFRYFRDGDREYLARTWLIAPEQAETQTKRKAQQQAWNGRDFYVSFGVDEQRAWADAIKYGFVSGGGGRWYSNTLKSLFPGARIFVNIPGTGYVGVGEVAQTVLPVREFVVEVDGQMVPIIDAPLEATAMASHADDPERCEYAVRVRWLETVPEDKAYWEKGMYANQNTVTRLRNQFTIDKLISHFRLED